MGLGLAIAKTIAAGLGGRIELLSPQGGVRMASKSGSSSVNDGVTSLAAISRLNVAIAGE